VGWLAEVDRLLGDAWDTLPVGIYNDEAVAGIRDAASSARNLVAARQQDQQLGPQALGALADLQGKLNEWAAALPSPDPALDAWRNEMDRFLTEERADPPDLAAGRELFGRLPAFVRFDGDARTLPTFTQFTDKPSTGLVNLLAAVDATFEHLASLSGSEGALEPLQEEERRINLQLEHLLGRGANARSLPPSRSIPLASG
jgi:hypothetical protein